MQKETITCNRPIHIAHYINNHLDLCRKHFAIACPYVVGNWDYDLKGHTESLTVALRVWLIAISHFTSVFCTDGVSYLAPFQIIAHDSACDVEQAFILVPLRKLDPCMISCPSAVCYHLCWSSYHGNGVSVRYRWVRRERN